MKNWLKNASNVVGAAKTMIQNRDNLSEALQLKEQGLDLLQKGVTLLDKVKVGLAENSLKGVLGVDNRILKGTTANVYSHLLKDTVYTHLIVNPNVLEKHNFTVNIDSDKLMINPDSQKWGEMIAASEFSVLELNLTKRYCAFINKQGYLGNPKLNLQVEADLQEKNNKNNILLNVKMYNDTGEVLATLSESLPLQDMEFNQTKHSFTHAHLPEYLTHYLGVNEKNQFVLTFVLS